MREAVVQGGHWLVWRPWRLLALILVLLVFWAVVASMKQEEDSPAEPEQLPTAPLGVELPEGWESWPSVTATHTGGGEK